MSRKVCAAGVARNRSSGAIATHAAIASAERVLIDEVSVNTDEVYVSSEHVVQITDASFEEQVVKAGKPVLIDFWAEWCGPCKMIAPMLNEIAAEYQGKLTIAKLNIDENPKTPQRFNVRGIPTLILFKNGQVEGQKVGALRKSDLAAFLDSKL